MRQVVRVVSSANDLHPIIGQFRELKSPLSARLVVAANVPQIRSAFDGRANYVDDIDYNLRAMPR